LKKQKKIPVFPSGNEKELTLQKKPILPMTIGSGVGVFFKKEVLLSTPERSVLGYGIAKGLGASFATLSP